MKKLFILALFPLMAHAAPAKKKAEPTPAVIEEPAPAPPKERKPGFWERAWTSTKKSTAAVGRTVARPFGGSKEKGDSKVGWRNLELTLTLDPEHVKLSNTRALKVGLAVVNRGKTAVQLDFPTTQRIEVLLRKDTSEILSKWSEDQKVEPEQGFLVINPEERLEYSATISTREMKAGQNYFVEAYFPNFPELRGSKTVTPAN